MAEPGITKPESSRIPPLVLTRFRPVGEETTVAVPTVALKLRTVVSKYTVNASPAWNPDPEIANDLAVVGLLRMLDVGFTAIEAAMTLKVVLAVL